MIFYLNPHVSRKLSTLAQHSHSSIPILNSQIKTLIQDSNYIKALKLHSPTTTTQFTYPSLLKACASLSNLNYGKTLHSSITVSGFRSDRFIAASLINMYVKCGTLDDAVKVFDSLCEGERDGEVVNDVAIWNSIVDGYFRFGKAEEGFARFGRMLSLGVRPDGYSLAILLGACDDVLGKQVHGFVLRNWLIRDPFLQSALVDMYLCCGLLKDALLLFERLEDRSNVVMWNLMFSGFCEIGFQEYSLELYSCAKDENVELSSASFSSVLSACCDSSICFGRQVHSDVIKMGFCDDPYVSTSLLTMYAKWKFIEEAEHVFNEFEIKELESWNAIISAYVGNGHVCDALEAQNQMRLTGLRGDAVTLLNILSSCSMAGLLDFGRSVHAEMIKRPLQSNVSLQSALVTLYSKCGCDGDAYCVFSSMGERDMVSWGSMISGFCQNGKYEEAVDLFKIMLKEEVKPDSSTMSSVVNCCAGMENVPFGYGIHGFAIKCALNFDTFVATSLIDMYSKHRLPDMAENVFSGMTSKNLVAWNSMMSCYVRNDLPELCFNLFSEITDQGWSPDSFSLMCLLAAISALASLLLGKATHGYLIRKGARLDLHIENALIDMYIKSGFLNYAQHIFGSMLKRSLVSYNSMIAGYGYHGECLRALGLFDDMKKLGVEPDNITFLSLISSCRHSGLVEEGLNLFDRMRTEYNIEPKVQDYVNVVDLLGRAGYLEDAYSLIKNMVIERDRSVWLCLLSACRLHKNVELGELAAAELLKMESSTGSNYVQLLNLYGEGELWDKAANVRTSMKERGLKKSPGCSWIELRDETGVFHSGDSSSPRTVEIYETLGNLSRNMGKKLACECLEGF